MKNTKPWFCCIKWGGVLGIALSLFEILKMIARNIDYASAKMFDIALIILLILVIYAGIKELKENLSARLSFAKAFLGSILITLVGSIIFFAYASIHYNYVDKDGLQKKREASLTHYRELIDNDTIKTNELSAYLDTVQQIMKSQIVVVCEDTVAAPQQDKIEKGSMLIHKFYAEKLTTWQRKDTADNYRLRNFMPYSRKILIETLETYLAQNGKESSTPYVQQVIEQTNALIPTVNPSDIRYEKRKSEVPQYEKTGVYVFICTFMNLLYGLFFGLFVALFHYTSKRPVATEDTAQSNVADNPENTVDKNMQ